MTGEAIEPKPKSYRLKSMVLARIFAEITVLLILVTLPAVLTISGQLQTAPMTGKFLFFALSLIAALILPAYAFITWRVVLDKNGLTTISVAKHQRCHFADMKRLSRRSNWNWVRYVIEHKDGELTFPIWLVNCEELVEVVRKNLPGGGNAENNPFRKFSQDRISLLFQCMQAALGIGLVVVFWIFFSELAQDKATNQSDLTMVLAFCLVISILFLWRSMVILLMPKSVELTPSGIVIDTMINSKRVTWPNVLKVKPAIPLLPEGFMLSTAKGSYLIGSGMDAADELVSSIISRLPHNSTAAEMPAKQKQSAPARDLLEHGKLEKAGSQPIEPPGTMDFSPEGTKSPDSQDKVENKATATSSEEPEDSNAKPEKRETATGADSGASDSPRRAAGGKKADRKFRKRKKKHPPRS